MSGYEKYYVPDQSKLPKLLSLYVDEMGSQKLLLNGANLVYDKAKIITRGRALGMVMRFLLYTSPSPRDS